MNAPINTEVLIRAADGQQPDLLLASEGVLRYLWDSRFGAILIELKGGQVYVNGALVEAASGASHENASVCR